MASSARTALRIGSSIETTVPNVSVRITIAAMIPISSLDSVAGFGDLLAELAAGLDLEPRGLGRIRPRR